MPLDLDSSAHGYLKGVVFSALVFFLVDLVTSPFWAGLRLLAAMKLLLAAVACAACASAVEFGLYDHEASPGGAWRIMDVADFTKHKEAFVASYNKLKGIKPIKLFQTKNCCFAVKGGEKLTVSGTAYGIQFPAATSGGIRFVIETIYHY